MDSDVRCCDFRFGCADRLYRRKLAGMEAGDLVARLAGCLFQPLLPGACGRRFAPRLSKLELDRRGFGRPRGACRDRRGPGDEE
jgi:hypothetical protein